MSNTTSSTGTGTIAVKWGDSLSPTPSFFSESSLSWSIPLLLLILCVCITPVIIITRRRCEYQHERKEQDSKDSDASRLARGLADALANTRPDPLRGTAEYEAQRAEEAKRRQELLKQQHQHQAQQAAHSTKIQILMKHGASSSASSFHEQPHAHGMKPRQGSIQYPEYSTIPSMNVLEIDDDVLIEIEQQVDRELRSMNMLVAASVDDAHVITVEPSKLKEMLTTQETLVMEQRKLRAQRRSQKLNNATGPVKQLTLCIPTTDNTTPSPSPSPSASPCPSPSYLSPAATTHVDSSNNDARRFLSPDIEMTASRVITYTTRPSPMSSRNGSIVEDEQMHMIRSQLFSSSGDIIRMDGELASPTATPTGSIHQIQHPHSPAASDIDEAQT